MCDHELSDILQIYRQFLPCNKAIDQARQLDVLKCQMIEQQQRRDSVTSTNIDFMAHRSLSVGQQLGGLSRNRTHGTMTTNCIHKRGREYEACNNCGCRDNRTSTPARGMTRRACSKINNFVCGAQQPTSPRTKCER